VINNILKDECPGLQIKGFSGFPGTNHRQVFALRPYLHKDTKKIRKKQVLFSRYEAIRPGEAPAAAIYLPCNFSSS
jgi:hypothetical protein